MNLRSKCRYYDECSAPLCPFLPDDENKNYIWYPDEEICSRKRNVPAWVKQQRKIAKKVNPGNKFFYFTTGMLNIPFRVTESVKGLDPDNVNEETQLKAWFKKNKVTKKRKRSDKLRKQRRRAMTMARKVKEEKRKTPIREAA